MARNPQTQGLNVNNAQIASAAALSDEDETPAPEIQPAPKLSPAEEISALQTRLNSLLAETQSLNPIDPGGTIRPTQGMIHPGTGTPIFNAGRPTGRAG